MQELDRTRNVLVGNHQRLTTLSVIAMVIVIIEFQGIHEARIQHKMLKQLHDQEQAALQMIEQDLHTVFKQAEDSLQGSVGVQLSLQGEHDADLPHVAGASSLDQKAAVSKSVRKESRTSKSSLNLPPSSTNHALIPSSLANLADLSQPYSKKLREMPFFWHITESDGSVVKDMYSDCYGLVEACESGLVNGHHRDITLKVVTLDSGWKFMNVDTTTASGIERASRLNLVGSGKADMVVSPLAHDVTTKLFLHQNRGRCFTVFQEPIERIVSSFLRLKAASRSPPNNAALGQMTLDEYMVSSFADNNLVTRTLLNKMETPLTDEDFLVAKEVLRTKCLIGLLDELEESVRRFDLYFGFGEIRKPDPVCTVKYVNAERLRRSDLTILPPQSPTYQILHRNNHLDLLLYDYARNLFAEQAVIFPTNNAMPTNSRK